MKQPLDLPWISTWLTLSESNIFDLISLILPDTSQNKRTAADLSIKVSHLWYIYAQWEQEAARQVNQPGNWIENYELSWVFWWRAIYTVDSNLKASIQEPRNYMLMSQWWEKQTEQWKENLINYIKDNDFDNYDFWIKSAICLLLIQNEIEKPGSIAWNLLEKFQKYSLLLLSYPRYLSQLDERKKNTFFLLFFLSQESNYEIKKYDSKLWKHLLQNFWNITTVKQHYENTKKTFWDNPQEKIDREEARIQLIVPSVWELETVSWVFRRDSTDVIEIRSLLLKMAKIKSVDLVDENNPDLWIYIFAKPQSKLKTFWVNKTSMPINYLCWENLKVSEKRKVLKMLDTYIPKNWFERWLIAMLIAKQENKDNFTPEEFMSFGFGVLIYPQFLIQSDVQEQVNYFSLFFSSITNHDAYKNTESPLWEYLKKYFWEIEIVKQELEKIEGKKQKELNAMLWISEEPEINIDILESNELKAILTFYNQSDSLATTVNELINNLRKYHNPHIHTLNPNNPIASLYWNFSNILPKSAKREWKLVDLFLRFNDLSDNEKQVAAKNMTEAIKSQSIRELLDLWLITMFLTKITEIWNNEYCLYISNCSSMLLLYPHFLKSLSQEEIDKFFKIFFLWWKDKEEICNLESEFWIILLKYFWNNQVIQSEYQKRQELIASSWDITYSQEENTLSFWIKEGKELQWWKKVVLAVFRVNSWWKKTGEVEFIDVEEIESFKYEVTEKILIEGAIVSKSVITTKQNKWQLCFTELWTFAKFIPKVENKQGNKNARKHSIEKKNSGKASSTKSQEDIQPDFEYLTLLSWDESVRTQSEWENTVVFSYEMSLDDIVSCKLWNIMLTNSVEITISQSPEVVSFFWVHPTTYTPNSVDMQELFEITQQIHRDRQVSKKEKEVADQKKAETRERRERIKSQEQGREEVSLIVEQAWWFNAKMESAYEIMLACGHKELQTKWEWISTTFHWCHEISNPIKAWLVKEASRFWFDLELITWKNWYYSALHLRKGDTVYEYDMNSYPIIMDYYSDNPQDSLLAHDIACRALAFMFHERFKTKTQEYKKVLTGVKKWKDIQTATRERLFSERAQIINPKNWETLMSWVSMKDEEVLSWNILGVSGFIRVWWLMISSERFDTTTPKHEIYKAFARELFMPWNEHLVKLFYTRVLLTLSGDTSKETSWFTNKKAIALINKDFSWLEREVDYQTKVETCVEVLKGLYKKNLPIEIVQPKVFTLEELWLLIWEKEKE